MKRYATLATAFVMAIAIAAAPVDLVAQTRTTSSGSTSRSTSSSGSSSASRSSQSSTVSRSTQQSAASRSSQSSTISRSTQQSSTVSRSSQSSAVSRSTQPATQNRTTGTGVVSRSTTTTPRTQASTVRSTTGSSTAAASRSSAGTGSTVSRTPAGTGTSVSHGVATDRRGVTATTPAGTRTQPVNRPQAGTVEPPQKPVQVKPSHDLHAQPHQRPMDRDFISYRQVGHFWDPGHHCFGFRVLRIPSRAERFYYHSHVYYCFDGVYYRPWGSHYIVCRPPYDVYLEWERAALMNLYRCRFNYYYTEARIYDAVYRNNRYIDEQYEIIAKNNEIIAKQNALIERQNNAIDARDGRFLAGEAFNAAQNLGLVQSYAYVNAEYYYQDGVFYVQEKGKYKVIIPPAGALVEYIPEDYTVLTLRDGNQYYQVDDTVYKVTIHEGVPYFEVMGQLYN